jgi:hypothetical protein
MKIYQLINFLNAKNRRSGEWEYIVNETTVAVGREGLKTLQGKFTQTCKRQEFLRETISSRKYSDIRGKVEINQAHIMTNGELANWGDKIIHSHNPDKM